jgi:ethanolamine permease
MTSLSAVSVDIQDASAGVPHRYAKVPHLWALGIGAVISGEFYGWQSSLVAGFDGLMILLAIVTVLYVTLSFSIAEMAATIPADGGPYIFALHAIGPRAAFCSGLAESIKMIAVNGSMLYTIYAYLGAVFDIDSAYAPLWFLGFGVVFTGLNLMGVVVSFRVQACASVLCVLLLLVFFGCAAPHLDYNKWVVEQDWKFTNWSDTIQAVPFVLWFYLGIEELPLANEETINPEKNMPRGLTITMATLVILSFGTAIFNSLISPGAAAMVDVETPLVAGFETIFGDSGVTTFFKWMTVIALVSSPNSYFFFMGQLFFAIARDGYYPPYLAKVDPRTGAASGGLIVGGALTIGVIIVLHFTIGDDYLGSVLINLTLLGGLISYLFQLVSFILLRVNQPQRPRPYRSPFGIPGAVVSFTLSLLALIAVLYTGITNMDFVASIIATVVVYLVGGVYFYKVVQPRLERKQTALSPKPAKEMRESLLSGTVQSARYNSAVAA